MRVANGWRNDVAATPEISPYSKRTVLRCEGVRIEKVISFFWILSESTRKIRSPRKTQRPWYLNMYWLLCFPPVTGKRSMQTCCAKPFLSKIQSTERSTLPLYIEEL